jgi:hypothetical protein
MRRPRMSELRIDIVRDPGDRMAAAPSVAWAIERLREAVRDRGGSATSRDGADPEGGVAVRVAGAGSRAASDAARAAGVAPPEGAETLALVPSAGGPVAIGGDARGLGYAVLELADRVAYAEDPLAALRPERPVLERPATRIRSVARLFCSDVEDRSWFHDERFWERYLSMLAANRFNRFSLTLGLGYNYHRGVTDAYLYFAYPFLLDVPGYGVRVPQLSDDERDRNLRMLRFASEAAVSRGLDFQLGLWTHAYEWIESPNARHTIEGLTPETHAPYCRDAIGALLEACPAIGGVTLRIHGESGVAEGSRAFWRSVFRGIGDCGRTVGIDLHAKGLDEATLADALETGRPVTVSPKFWAEHMGLPYHQAAIRESERVPRADPSERSEWHRYMKVSEGSRPFTRYGYADFLREDRPYDVVFRLWAGTQRVLLWGDPAWAAAYGRAAGIAGAGGLEWCEPLTFKGREGSGLVGSRTGYADPSLVPRDDWEKYAYTYRLFGRLTYEPDAPAEVWRRPLRARLGPAARDAEAALASASRILPLVTVAHHPSASNNYYWPEIYTDMPIVWSETGTRPHPYLDTPEPRRFGTVGPLDPEVFEGVADYVDELRDGAPSGRVTPLDVARHLEHLAHDATERIAAAEALAADRTDVEMRRWSIDVGILEALGRFFAGKLRAAVGYELYSRTRSRVALGRAVDAYRVARRAWADAAARADGVYVGDLTFGPQDRIRGHWRDRLPAIDADLAEMERRLADASEVQGEHAVPELLDREATMSEPRLEHVPPEGLRPGKDLEIALGVRTGDAFRPERAELRYRPMNQALAVSSREMERRGERFIAAIPGDELDGRYPLAYAFVLRDRFGVVRRFPGLGPDLAATPYLVLRSERPLVPNGPDRPGLGVP